jgi:hypothetical protein
MLPDTGSSSFFRARSRMLGKWRRCFGQSVCVYQATPRRLMPPTCFFGNRNAEVRVFDRQLSAAVLGELIAQGLSLPERDGAGNGGVNLPPIRSRLLITENQQIRTANGTNIPFSDIVPRTKVHCPFHHDVHPSAFVLANRGGMKGLHVRLAAAHTGPKGHLRAMKSWKALERLFGRPQPVSRIVRTMAPWPHCSGLMNRPVSRALQPFGS